jgi:hypothetical protein
MKKSTPQKIASMCLGAIAAGIYILFKSWFIFAVALAIILLLDAWKDSRFRRLEVEANK